MEKSEPLPGVISRHFLSHQNICCYLVYFCKSLSSDDQRACCISEGCRLIQDALKSPKFSVCSTEQLRLGQNLLGPI